MADFDGPDMLRRMKLYAKRPATDLALTDPDDYYDFLSQAQREIFEIVAVHVPQQNYGTPELMVTSDGGYTYTVSGNKTMLGHFEVRESPTGRLLVCGSEFDTDADFTLEEYQSGGTLLRCTNNRPRLFPNGPWVRYVQDPSALISASSAPKLVPKNMRIVIVWRALQHLCARLDLDPTKWEKWEQQALWGDENGAAGWIAALKTQVYGQGVTAAFPAGGRTWYRGGPDFVR